MYQLNCYTYQHNMKDLKYIHITKTGGTFIENFGRMHNISWGKFHKEYASGSTRQYTWFHEILSVKSTQLQEKYDWFMFVRNPYDRIISEYNCRWGGSGKKKTDNVEDFNRLIRRKIHSRSMIGDHYTEQWRYLSYPSPSVRILVYRFENFRHDFQNILARMGISELIPVHKHTRSRFNVQDFDPKTLSLIRKVYVNDFIIFNYSTDISLSAWQFATGRSELFARHQSHR